MGPMITDAYIDGDKLIIYCRLVDDIYDELASREVHVISLTHAMYAMYIARSNL